MVLYSCDGVLAIYSGSTGQQLEVIKRFEDPTAKLKSVPYDEYHGKSQPRLCL